MIEDQWHSFLESSPWRNIYWFARMLINSDKYGGVGNDAKTLAQLGSEIRRARDKDHRLPEDELCDLLRTKTRSILTERWTKAKSKLPRVLVLCDDLDKKLLTFQDFEVFALTCELVMIPINEALSKIPNDDKQYTEAVARKYLDSLGEGGLATVINLWDDVGIEGCLNAERLQVVVAFQKLRKLVPGNLAEADVDIVLTAFVQEFERRLGQKRKGRAGGSLEDVTSFILDYFHIQATHAPEHFQSDIEVDKWVRSKDGWLTGISCKRTLRERWKQVSSADYNLLSKFKIKYIWHVITYDEDLSDDKLALLGGQRHLFYLRDDSRRYQHASTHLGLNEYVRPMSRFISDLKAEQGISKSE